MFFVLFCFSICNLCIYGRRGKTGFNIFSLDTLITEGSNHTTVDERTAAVPSESQPPLVLYMINAKLLAENATGDKNQQHTSIVFQASLLCMDVAVFPFIIRGFHNDF